MGGTAAERKPGLLDMRGIVLAACVTLLILSDCLQLFDGRGALLKYPALVLLAAAGVMFSFGGDFERGRVVRCSLGLALLIAEIPFQPLVQSLGAAASAIALYVLVAVLALTGPALMRSPSHLFICACTGLAVVILVLVWSREDCVRQLQYYISVARPRFFGAFSNPNSLGGMSSMLFMLFCACRMLYTGVDPARAKTSLAGAVVCVGLVAASGSRTSAFVCAGFVLATLVVGWLRGPSSGGVKMGLAIVGAMALFVAAALYLASLSDDAAFSYRVNTLLNIRLYGEHTLCGLGYVSSTDIWTLTSAAGGAVDMLWTSLFYRVGIVGIAGYVFLFLGALAPRGLGRVPTIACAFAVAVLLQTFGESYLSSALSFVSAFIWIGLASLGDVWRSTREGGERA